MKDMLTRKEDRRPFTNNSNEKHRVKYKKLNNELKQERAK